MATDKPRFDCPYTLEVRPDGSVVAHATTRDGTVQTVEVPNNSAWLAELSLYQPEGQDGVNQVYQTGVPRPPTA